MTPRNRIRRTMRAQLEHDAWRRHIPEPAPEPRYLQLVVMLLAVLVLLGGLGYLVWAQFAEVPI